MKSCKRCSSDITGTHHKRKYCGDHCKRQGFLDDNPTYFYSKHIEKFYGITLGDYNRMGDVQGWLCAICRNPPTGKSNGKRLVVDHCHNTGKVRALLCSYCNKGIGSLRDDPEIVAKAVAYLEEYAT